MKKITFLIVGALVVSTTTYFLQSQQSEGIAEKNLAANPPLDFPLDEETKTPDPNDLWTVIRSYPDGFDQAAYLTRLNQVKASAYAAADSREIDLSLDWQQEGPGNIGGRINVLTVSPTDHDIIYAGATNGGIFKTTNGGADWNPIFDDLAYLSIGSITLNPDDEDIIYVGTGDRNFGGSSHIGNGVYKSLDAGETWEAIGLEETGIVSEILIDPTNPDRIFASTLGNPFDKNEFRGVYRSDDGGVTWENKLFITDSSGIIDLIMDPSNPDILYASGYNRMRNYYQSRVSGPQARIYKTVNGGDSWTELGGGLPMEDNSRIGLAISNDDPNTIYALYVDGETLNPKDIYKSTNSGSTWAPMNIYAGFSPVPEGVMGGFGWYFGEVYLNPYNNDQLIIPGVDMYQTLNGGSTWNLNVPEWWTYEVHADKHAIAFLDEDSYIIATDGGLYKTNNNGASWTDIENLPITQFYHIDVHPHTDGLYGGGAQDNGSMSGNALSFNAWERLFGGDGFRVTFLEEDAGAAYYETQNGGLRHRDAGGFTTNVSPDLIDGDRVNWDMPYFINEVASELFVGSAHIQLMTSAPYGDYNYISDDLTRIGMGESYGAATYHNITEMDQPSNSSDVLYVGTSDGLMWLGERTGGDFEWDWTNYTGSLPNRYITGVRCSPNNPNTVYVCLSGYKNDEDIAYLYKRDGIGSDWEDVSGDLPGITVNDILIVPGHDDDEYLFAALDGGVYFSSNAGASWDYVGVGLPFATVSELHLDLPNKKLVAGTYSRSMWSYDVAWMFEEEEVDDTGLDDYGTQKHIKTYPNPATDVVYFESVSEDEIFLFDQQGRLVLKQQINHLNNYSKVDLSTLQAGLYYFKFGSRAGKFIKN